MKEVVSKIRTRCLDVPWSGVKGEKRIHVNEVEVASQKGILLFGKYWFGYIKFGKRFTKGISESDF